MIRVTLLSHDVSPTSGWGTVTYELCWNLFQRRDISFQLHLPAGVSLNTEIPFSANIRQTLPRWTGTFRRCPHRLPQFLFPKVSIEETDIIHTLIEFPYGILAHKLAQKARVPFIISAHGTYGVYPLFHWINRRAYKQALRRAAAVTVPSYFTADAICQHSGIQPQISVVHNAVNYNRFQKLQDLHEIRGKFGLPAEARVLLGVGAMWPRKGFDVLLKAFARVVKDEPRAHLVIAGDGDTSSLEDLATSMGIRSQVHLLGKVTGNDLVGLYQLCEIYSHLPRYVEHHFEGFGLVYLEAGACGKPVVATRSGGVTDAVLDGETGILVEEEDDEAAAAAFVRLLQNKDLAQSMGEAGRKYASKHTWSGYVDQIVDLYTTALHQTQRTSR